MALSATLYNISANPRVVDKPLGSPVLTANALAPYEELSNLTGKLILAYNADALNANYCKLTETDGQYTTFEKYYYITDVSRDIGQKMNILLRTDVLMTYKSDIMNCEIIANRSDTLNNCDIADGLFRHEARQDIEQISFVPVVNRFDYPDCVIMTCSV